MTYIALQQAQTYSLSTPRTVGGRTDLHAGRLQAFGQFPSEPRILLLEPFYPPESVWGNMKVEQGYLPPLGTLSIYRWLQHQGYQVEFLDTQFGDYDESQLRTHLANGAYDLIGLPLFTPTASHVFDTARIIRSVLPNCVIVYGGVHATSLSVETLEESPEADFIIRREGEETLTELIEALKVGKTEFWDIEGLTWPKDSTTIVMNPERTLLKDLDDLPVGVFGDLDLSRYVPHPNQYIRLPNYPFVSQRGCPYPCTFCEAHVALGKKLRLFSPERVIEELKILKYEKGAKGLYFQDSTFTMHRKYVTKLFELMIREGVNDLLWSCTTRTDRVDPDLLALMYEAGCRNIAYGIESANPQSLDVIRKNITPERQEEAVRETHDAKITMLCSYILCLPGETEEMVQNTIDYAKRLRSQMALFYLPVPYPSTELAEACEATGGLRKVDNWNEYLSIDFKNPVYVNPLIGKERMKYWYKRAYMEYYSSPRIWMSNLRALMWHGGLNRYFRGANAVRALITSNLSDFLRAIPRGYHGQASPYKSSPEHAPTPFIHTS